MTAQNQIINKWRERLTDSGLVPELVSAYMAYAERLLSRHLPVVFEFSHLARLLGRTPAYLASVINSSHSHYRLFTIPKRRSGRRTIAAPYPALLECQQWINRCILSQLPAHSAAHGFVSKRSILTNASLHLNQRCLLKLDLVDFFPSIPIRRVIKVFREAGYTANVSFYLAQLCCLDDAVPQGAATSPALSNIIARRLDARLSGLSRKLGLRYTRYADDLTFSGDGISPSFVELVRGIVDDEGFCIRDDKTRLCRSKGRRVVTGLSVAGEILRVPRAYKRKLRQEVHFVRKYGFFSHVAKRRIRNPFYLDSILGKLMFWSYIEPADTFVRQALADLRRQMNSL